MYKIITTVIFTLITIVAYSQCLPQSLDSDNDGICDILDKDDDNDEIPDIKENDYPIFRIKGLSVSIFPI